MREFGPLPSNHPAVGDECKACQKDFVTGDITTLVALGPGDDEEEQQKCQEGRAYISAAVLIHAACGDKHVV